MKTLRVCLLSIILILFFPTIALANAGPTYWQGYPSWETMAIDKNSPILVTSEDLVFDFSQEDHLGYSLNGDVSASYQMNNPSDKDLSVQMAFPLVERFGEFKKDQIKISADGKELAYKVYIGDGIDINTSHEKQEQGDFDFSDILSTITEEDYKAKNFTREEKGKLYTINVEPMANEEINIGIDFAFDPKTSKVLIYGFNGLAMKEEGLSLSAWCYHPTTLEVFVLGEDIDLDIKGFKDGEMLQETNRYSYDITSKEINIEDYIYDYSERIVPIEDDWVSPSQLYNLYAKEIDQCFSGNGVCSEHDLFSIFEMERFFTLVYEVEFQPNSAKELKVNYQTSSTMDRRKTKDPLYTINYILNPAQYWKDFNNLYIRIITNEQAPYIVDSSIDFIREDDNTYTATLDKLPEKDLTFTLYNKYKVTFFDKIMGQLGYRTGYFTPIVLGMVALALVLMIVKLFKKSQG